MLGPMQNYLFLLYNLHLFCYSIILPFSAQFLWLQIFAMQKCWMLMVPCVKFGLRWSSKLVARKWCKENDPYCTNVWWERLQVWSLSRIQILKLYKVISFSTQPYVISEGVVSPKCVIRSTDLRCSRRIRFMLINILSNYQMCPFLKTNYLHK